jgi:hypothetical protein
VIAGLDARHIRAHLFHDPCPFVTEDSRQRRGEIAGHEMPIAVADAGGGDPHEDLAAPRRIEHEFLDHEWRTWRMEHGGFHGNTTCASSPSALSQAPDYTRRLCRLGRAVTAMGWATP